MSIRQSIEGFLSQSPSRMGVMSLGIVRSCLQCHPPLLFKPYPSRYTRDAPQQAQTLDLSGFPRLQDYSQSIVGNNSQLSTYHHVQLPLQEMWSSPSRTTITTPFLLLLSILSLLVALEYFHHTSYKDRSTAT
ncbi:accessory protein [Ginger chlorotic fleck-associated tombusvirus]|nr:accessory protein [Ginger chlorotic fleck-associated tombusvirus]